MHLKLPPPIVCLIGVIAIVALTRAVPQLSVSFPGQNVLALVIFIAGFGFAATAITKFGAVKTTITPLKPENASTLVTDGAFKYSRNPMYLALALLLTAITIYLGGPAGLIVIAAFVAYITEFQIKPEEAALREKFGAAYEEYCKAVRRWI